MTTALRRWDLYLTISQKAAPSIVFRSNSSHQSSNLDQILEILPYSYLIPLKMASTTSHLLAYHSSTAVLDDDNGGHKTGSYVHWPRHDTCTGRNESIVFSQVASLIWSLEELFCYQAYFYQIVEGLEQHT